MEITLIIAGGILLGCLIGLSWFAGTDAPYVPTRMDHLKKVLKAAGVKKGKKFYELGSGDGRVVIEAAEMGTEAIGIEQSWTRVLYSRWKVFKQKFAMAKNCRFFHGDVFMRNYQDADIVYIYLLPKGVEKLENKLRKELNKGSIIITQTFHFKTLKPFKTMDFSKDKVYKNDIRGAGNFWLYKR